MSLCTNHLHLLNAMCISASLSQKGYTGIVESSQTERKETTSGITSLLGIKYFSFWRKTQWREEVAKDVCYRDLQGHK